MKTFGKQCRFFIERKNIYDKIVMKNIKRSSQNCFVKIKDKPRGGGTEKGMEKNRLDLCINELVDYAVTHNLIEKEDKAYATCRLMAVFGTDAIGSEKPIKKRELCEILSELCDIAYERGIIESDSTVFRDLFDTRVMGELTPRPSEVIKSFRERYKESPKEATDYFYRLACDSNYLRLDRILRDVKWSVPSEYGDIDISINRSKPEKDPKAIAAARLLPQTDYPKCALCHENEGFAGNPSKPARQNLRQIPFTMDGERWYLQYSPYVYYNEHCIALSEEHRPMKIDRSTFKKLLGFITEFPHYFIGSNADLKIVGGSILSHDHMQGGRYEFAMERAGIEIPINFTRYPTVTAGIVKWPMSVIRIRSTDKAALISLADEILTAWRGYTDESAFIFAETDGEPHNTVTPIARRRGEEYEIDLVLRNNLTTEEHPLGVYHPHADLHNIKKENIGLIEVMGLAILPSRLIAECEEIKKAILSGKNLYDLPETAKHAAWVDSFRRGYTFTEENTDEILRAEIGKAFVRVLSDAGVYKCTEDGRAAFLRFVESIK